LECVSGRNGLTRLLTCKYNHILLTLLPLRSNPSYKTPPRYSGDQKVDINFLGRQG